MIQPRIRLEGIAKRFYGGQVAVHPLDLSVMPGQFAVILGPSGSGKSTTLRLISGLEVPSAGKVFVDGMNVTSYPASLRDMALSFQFYALYPHLNAVDNVAFPLIAQGIPVHESNHRARSMLSRLGLKNRDSWKPGRLSGGDQQRIALARALVRDPRAFLLDEPLANLDGAMREELQETLRVLHNEAGSTTLLVTHDQAEAMALADFLVVMREGRILQAGTPRELYDRPDNLFVAHFLGTPGMNLLRGNRRGEWVQLVDIPMRIRVADQQFGVENRSSKETACYLGIRAEHVLLTEDGARSTVVFTEALGSRNILEVRSPNETELHLILPPGIRYSAGQPIKLTVIPSGCRWFNAESGQSLPWKTLEVLCPRSE